MQLSEPICLFHLSLLQGIFPTQESNQLLQCRQILYQPTKMESSKISEMFIRRKRVQNMWIEGFPHSSDGKESNCNAGDPGLIPGLGRSLGKGIGYPLQFSWASLVVQVVKNLPAMWETWIQSLGWEDPWRKAWQPTPVFSGFPVVQLVKNPLAMRKTWIWPLGWEDSLEKGKGILA